MPRRTGDKDALWDGVTTFNQTTAPHGGVNVSAGGTSAIRELPRRGESLAIFVTTSGATTVTLQAAHSGDITSEGMLPDANANVWHTVVYTNITMALVFAGAGSSVMIVPDFVMGYIRLHNLTGSVTITAGYEVV